MPGWPSQSPPGLGSQAAAPQPHTSSTSSPAVTFSSDSSIENTNMLIDPAYVPVLVRHGFGAYPPPPSSYAPYASYQQPPSPMLANPSLSVPVVTASPPEPPKQRVEWPESVRDYVQRSFLPANTDPTISRGDVEAKLKEVISAAKDSGHLYTVDWNAMPLPQVLIRTERDAEYQRTMSKSSSNSPYPDSPFSGSAVVPKKRKSSDLVPQNDQPSPQPPWRTTNSTRSIPLEDRISQPSPDKRSSVDEPLPKSSKFQKQLEKRQRRFDGGYKSAYRSPSPPPSSGPVIGTSQVLEKKYLRLTAPPVPSQVRPEHILRQTMDLLKKKWKKEANYAYICDQLKSMRQDLTVQRIKNEFTVSVYELHARIALEKGDLGEYNQCQTQLRYLYALGLKGNPIEFKAYRILYFIHTANRSGLNEALADLTPAEKSELPIKHALDVRSALALGNYHKFFQLYLDTPNMGAYLMDMFVARERLAALCNICKS
jgi:SAC3 family protein LENG8/THP3